MNIFSWLIIGGSIGWFATGVMRPDAQQGIALNVVIGIVGALLGGWLLSPLLGIVAIRNQSDFLATLGETTQVFTLLLAGIAAVSLLVGGIGIMNIMLVSVTERTREIGVRKALGATQANILLQFLIEALVLCMMGGVIGILFGTGASILLRTVFGWSTSVGVSSVLYAFLFAATVGIVFGVWPARRAAGLDPIQALRYE